MLEVSGVPLEELEDSLGDENHKGPEATPAPELSPQEQVVATIQEYNPVTLQDLGDVLLTPRVSQLMDEQQQQSQGLVTGIREVQKALIEGADFDPHLLVADFPTFLHPVLLSCFRESRKQVETVKTQRVAYDQLAQVISGSQFDGDTLTRAISLLAAAGDYQGRKFRMSDGLTAVTAVREALKEGQNSFVTEGEVAQTLLRANPNLEGSFARFFSKALALEARRASRTSRNN
jgi:hypothetical protein